MKKIKTVPIPSISILLISLKGGDVPGHMYINIFRNSSVGLFQKHFASVSETQF